MRTATRYECFQLGASMPVSFSTFSFQNKAGIDVTVTLEAPKGTVVFTKKVVGGGGVQHRPAVDNVQTVKVSVADEYGAHSDSEEIETTGKPSRVFIEGLDAEWFPGAITGRVVARF